MTNLIDFRLAVENATLPNTIIYRKVSTISFSWKNRGVAYVYQPISIAMTLLNSSNKVIQKQWLPGVKPKNWQPGKTILTSTLVTFTGIRAGTYKFAIGFFVHTSDKAPTYKLASNMFMTKKMG